MRINQKEILEMMKTFIAIDQPDLLENIKFNLEKSNKFTIVGSTSNGTECLNFFNQKSCDLLILDLMLSEIDGLGVLKRLKEMNKQTFQKVICITQFTNQTICNMLEELGENLIYELFKNHRQKILNQIHEKEHQISQLDYFLSQFKKNFQGG